jgi:hypothetical protein
MGNSIPDAALQSSLCFISAGFRVVAINPVFRRELGFGSTQENFLTTPRLAALR